MQQGSVIASLVLAGALVARGAAVAQTVPPRVAVWSTDQESFRRGDRVRVWFRSDMDAFVTVFRIDTDGRVRVLFPRDPGDAHWTRANTTYAIPNPYDDREPHAFAVDDYPGVGYLFAIASIEPFRFDGVVRNAHWDYRGVASNGRISGDPYVALTEVAVTILPAAGTAYGYDVVPYFVERRYDYPRFACYQCHRYVAYPLWDPYRDWCSVFQLEMYDPPRVYIAGAYPPTDVVLPAPDPQFVFQPRRESDPPMVRIEGERDGAAPRQRGVTGRDVGGVGSVRTPPNRPAAGQESRGILGTVRRLLGVEGAPAPRSVTPQATPRGQRPAEPVLQRRRPEASSRPAPGSGATRPAPTPSGTVRRPEPSSTPATRRPDTGSVRRPTF